MKTTLTLLFSIMLSLFQVTVLNAIQPKPIEQITQQGSISFYFKIDEDLKNGPGSAKGEYNILSLENFGRLFIKQSNSVVLFRWEFVSDDPLLENTLGINVPLPHITGEKWHHMILTWDTDQQFLDGYLNGNSLRMPGTKIPKWEMPALKNLVSTLGDKNIQVENLDYQKSFIAPQAVQAIVPKERYGDMDNILGSMVLPKPITPKKRSLLYETSFADYLSTKGWVSEGPISITHENNWLVMKSHTPDPEDNAFGHTLFWAPQIFPEDFIAEWEVQFLQEDGLAIVYFCTEGIKGEDIFHPSLNKRNGVFSNYIRSDINSYHISYYANNPRLAPGRIASNLRKNSGFYLVSNGPISIKPGSLEVHKAQLIKKGDHIQMNIDGTTIIDYIDDGKTYGPVHGKGRIGLRQMRWTQARYRNFKVWEIE